MPSSPETHGRVALYNGSMDLSDLLEMEMEGEYDQTGNRRDRGEMLITGKQPPISTRLPNSKDVTVSADERVRDNLRGLVQTNLDKKMRLLELEYQPLKGTGFWGSI